MTRRHLHLDGESFSAVDLKKTGAHCYWEDESTDIYCVAYAFDDEEPRLWFPGDPVPRRIALHIEQDGAVYAWNVAFERCMWRERLSPKYGWPLPKAHQFCCTMSEAMIMNLPGQLDKAGPAIGGQIVKDKDGHRLMLKMCKPRKLRKAEACPVCGDKTCRDCGPYYHNTEANIERLGKYCVQDVRTEQALANFVLPMSKPERKIFLLDAAINDRGVFIDKKLCEASQVIVEKATAKIDAQIRHITLGEVQGVNAATQLVRWLKNEGLETDSVAKDVLDDLLIRDDLTADVRRVLELRQEGSKTSTAKIASMLSRRQIDGRMRGNLQYYGASATGRWAARGTQLQNLTRPKILKGKGKDFDKAVNEALLAITYGDVRLLEMMYDKPMTVVSDCIRSLIVAPRGRELLACDFSNIEGRVVAWQAGQYDKLDAFREFDNGTGPDLYVLQASGIFGIPLQEAADDFYRQIGKVAELSLGFQGGPRAFAAMGKNYGMKLEKVRDRIIDSASQKIYEAATEAWPERGKSTGIEKASWIAAEIVKLAWRAKNYRIAASWRETEDCALKAMNYPGETFETGVIKYRFVAPFLFCRLPSGRPLCYPFAELRDSKTPWGDVQQKIVYKSTNQFTKKWERKAFYGGLAVENITQAIARDIMAEAMLRTEGAGYETVLSVHDEIINEVDEGFGSLDEFRDLMVRNPAWATDLPITASGWRGTRYKKG
jgi:DNA polymerase